MKIGKINGRQCSYYDIGSTMFCYENENKNCYYKIVSGKLFTFMFSPYKQRGLKVQKLKWELSNTMVIPNNDFENKEFYYLDVYKLVPEDEQIYAFNDVC